MGGGDFFGWDLKRWCCGVWLGLKCTGLDGIRLNHMCVYRSFLEVKCSSRRETRHRFISRALIDASLSCVMPTNQICRTALGSKSR